MSRATAASLLLILTSAGAAAAPATDARDPVVERHWSALHEQSFEPLALLADSIKEMPGLRRVADGFLPEERDGRSNPADPWILVVGFTGGREGPDSDISGVVEIRRRIVEHLGDGAGVMALTYNNSAWREASRDIGELVRLWRLSQECAPGPSLPEFPQPLVLVYGHSWGGGAIGRFARELRDEGLEISLAVYIDAFGIRNPRLPDNIRYAVNFYQRAGLLRGLPLRGKRKLIPESPASTVVLGSYQLTPRTDRFGWSWNVALPLLYRQHHRIGHDVRLQRYLVETIDVMLDLAGRSPVSLYEPTALPGE